MLRRVLRLERAELLFEVGQLAVRRFRAVLKDRRDDRGAGFLLAQERLVEGLVLLRAAESLNVCLKLSIQPAQNIEVRLLFFGKRTEILPFECREFLILFVELALRFVELAGQEVRRLNRLLLAFTRVLLHEHRGNFGADLLCRLRIFENDAHVEARQAVVQSARHLIDRLDRDRGAELRDQIFHVQLLALVGIQAEFFDDRFKTRTAQNLFLHRRQAVIQVVGDDRLDVFRRNAGLIDQNERLGGIFLGYEERRCETDRAAANDGDGQNPPICAKNSAHFGNFDFTVSNHMLSCVVPDRATARHRPTKRAKNSRIRGNTEHASFQRRPFRRYSFSDWKSFFCL